MIGKVVRGTNVGRLLCYLYGPGKANEHTDPHLVAGFSDPADLEPRIRANGTRDFRRLTGLLAQPMASIPIFRHRMVLLRLQNILLGTSSRVAISRAKPGGT